MVPQNGWFITEIPIKLDDLGSTTIFGNTQIKICTGDGHLCILELTIGLVHQVTLGCLGHMKLTIPKKLPVNLKNVVIVFYGYPYLGKIPILTNIFQVC